MECLLPIIARGSVVAAVALLVASLIPVKRLVDQLPQGSVRGKWSLQIAMILVFVVGLIAYANQLHRCVFASASDLLVPGLFLTGACFVMMVNVLALQTTRDVRRIASLEFDSITDPLTGLHNRRCLEQRLRQEAARARRYGFPLSYLLVDVDHFKDVNDRYGHPAGDVVLRELGSLFARSVRSGDFVARYGGDEVTILAPHTALSDAATIAEHLRRAVETSMFAWLDKNGSPLLVNVTISIGVATLETNGGNVRALVADADEALYRAKRGGRNCVAVSQAEACVRKTGALS